MKLSIHAVAQAVALIVQYASMASNVVPTAYKPIVALVIGIGQATLAFVAHYSTPPDAIK